MAANINPQGTADTGVGRAVPLAFALATIGVLLIAWTFVRLTQRFNHAGSVYGFVGATLGPRAGVISGWALMGTYTFYGVVTSTAAGIFGADFLDALGIWTNQPGWAPFVVGALALAGVWALAASNIRGGTRVLLVIEGTTVALILIVSVIILIRLAAGAAPNDILSGERQVAAWEVVVPFLALVVIDYTLLRNVYPYPTDAGAWYPIIAALWVIVGVLLTFVRSAATRRAGEKLMAEEGLAAGGGSRMQG
jgi:amino acid transporter